MLAFVHTPKTAGQTVSVMLRSSFGLHHCDVLREIPHPFSADDLRFLKRIYPSLKSIAGHRVVPYADLEKICPSVKYFVLMRDPIQRCASFFQFVTQKKGRGFDFGEWLQRNGNGQTRQIAGTEDVNLAIQVLHEKNVFVGLVEYFDESMLLMKSLFASNLNIAYKRKNTAQDNEVKRKLLASNRFRSMLIEANQEDLALYAYVKQELYPSYRQECGDGLQRDWAEYQRNKGRINQRNIFINRVYRNLVYKPVMKFSGLLT